tara:strand:+ start:1167 stop:1739 length:573 start_codon:yes stop_codon:yes gene_type:complete
LNKEKIIDIFESTGALLKGHFVLSSGLHSDTYFQCAKVLQFPEYLQLFAKMICTEFADNRPDLVISPAIGGIVIGTEVGRQFGVRTVFSERKQKKMIIRRGFEILPNEKVLVVEDVITTGGSVNEVIEILKENKCKIIGLAVLVDRSNGKIKLHKNQYSIASIDSSSYQELDLPKELARIPIQKPGSRFS